MNGTEGSYLQTDDDYLTGDLRYQEGHGVLTRLETALGDSNP